MTKEETKGYAARFPIPLYAELRAAAKTEGRSVNAILEDAATAYVAQRTHGVSFLSASATPQAFSSTYDYPDSSNSARLLRSSGVEHEDVIAQLAGRSPEED